MHLACFVSFMMFHFFLNLDLSAKICPIRTLILISFIFFKKKFKICARQPAQMELFQNKASQHTFFLILNFFCISLLRSSSYFLNI